MKKAWASAQAKEKDGFIGGYEVSAGEKGAGEFQDVIIRDFFGRTSGPHPHGFRGIRHVERKGSGIDFTAFFPGGFLLQKLKGGPGG